jgi:hypothetical protein
MPPDNDDKAIKITLEDLAGVATPEAIPSNASAGQLATGTRNYGSVAEAAEKAEPVPEDHGSIFLQGWFYLGLAGFVGAFLGWAIAEPGFVDGGGRRWGNTWITPLIVTLLCLGFGIAESIVERSVRKALLRAAMSLPLGVILGFVFSAVADLIFAIAVAIAAGAGVQSSRNPAFWVARGIGWMVLGAAGGAVYGIVGQSSKKALYGILGGVIGAGLGGVIFDPIAQISRGGAVSRAVGFSLFGLATGIAMGLVESALKDRWLYVTAGPLAGKQFILYKPQTTIGSSQQSDIYLFKDPSVLPKHAVVEINGARVQIRALGDTQVFGRPIHLQVLQSGASVRIGRYGFRYQERHRK